MESYVPMAFGAEAPKTPVKGNSQTCTRLHARRAPLSASSPEEAWEEIGNRKRQAGSEQGLPIKNKKIIKKNTGTEVLLQNTLLTFICLPFRDILGNWCSFSNYKPNYKQMSSVIFFHYIVQSFLDTMIDFRDRDFYSLFTPHEESISCSMLPGAFVYLPLSFDIQPMFLAFCPHVAPHI